MSIFFFLCLLFICVWRRLNVKALQRKRRFHKKEKVLKKRKRQISFVFFPKNKAMPNVHVILVSASPRDCSATVASLLSEKSTSSTPLTFGKCGGHRTRAFLVNGFRSSHKKKNDFALCFLKPDAVAVRLGLLELTPDMEKYSSSAENRPDPKDACQVPKGSDIARVQVNYYAGEEGALALSERRSVRSADDYCLQTRRECKCG